MDFHSLSRRELQAFCKKNKIPANMTNAAMADALKALEIVEGIEEFMQQPSQSQSESAQSSIELLDSSEVTSPFVPPTAGRSTRRRNVLKDDVEAVTSTMTTTRRTTRKTAAKVANESHVDAMETPAVVAQASRRKVQIASACLKMDSHLKECVDEEKKDALMTPAAVAVASRRRRAAEETEKKVYSTRRSVRLAVKNVQTLSGVKSEGSELSNCELFSKDCEDQEVNQKEGLNGCDEQPGITGVGAIETMEEDKEKSEVVSAEKEDITMGEMELGSTREEEKSIDFAVEVQPDEEICDNTEYPGEEDAVVPVNVNDEVQQSEGPVDVPTCETVVTVENSNEVDIQIDAGSQDEAGDSKEVKIEVNAVVSDDKIEVECEDGNEVMDQDLNATLGKLTLEQEADCVDLGIPEEPKQTEMGTPQVEEAVGGVKNSPSKQQCDGVLHDVSLEMGSKPLKTGFSDNKENVGSGTEMVIMKETIKPPAKDSGESLRSLEEESLRKLTKMLKEKLQISNKSSNHGTGAQPRSALQVLPENQLIGGNGK